MERTVVKRVRSRSATQHPDVRMEATSMGVVPRRFSNVESVRRRPKTVTAKLYPDGIVNSWCEQVMNSTLIAANQSVIEDLQLNFGDDKDIEEIDDGGLVRSKTFDAVVFDVLKISPESIANQLTLIEVELFRKIRPEELTCCAWTAPKKKMQLCPNVVEFIKRFNHVSFWVTREILSSNTAKNRAEKISYFIKVAKHLLELNNLNCLKALVSSLHSAPIHRLTLTWNVVPKRDKEKLEKLNELISEEDNRLKLREYLKTARLPCIPYLGMYLTDLTYINTIHPFTGGLDIERNNKMNEILRLIADFQQSEYEDLEVKTHLTNYLLSVKYIEELQTFMEDDNYKLSLTIEPPTTTTPRETRSDCAAGNALSKDLKRLLSDPDDALPHRPKTAQPTSLTPKPSSLNLPESPFRGGSQSPDKFAPGHRKAHSLGSNSAFQALHAQHSSISSSLSSTSTGSRSLLDDSVVEEGNDGTITDPLHQRTLTPSEAAVGTSVFLSATTSYDSGLDHDEPEPHPIVQGQQPSKNGTTSNVPNFILQGFLKRKTHLKTGYRPKVANWQRYWVGITGSSLIYYLPKYRAFGGHERSNFRTEPHKVVSLTGSTCFAVGDVSNSDLFQLTDERGENVHRFKAGSSTNVNIWVKYIRNAIDDDKATLPANLITFDDSTEDSSSSTNIL